MQTDNHRRQFFKTLIGAGAATGALTLASAKAKPPVNAPSQSTPSRGYRETAHIRAYYNKINF